MKTYLYCEDNGSATLILSARNQEEADENLAELVKDTDEWRFDGVEDEDDEDED